MRLRHLLWAALALARPVAAAPFDQYQLIMWQEHTPAEIAGLERLGFTALKLRATGGVVDEADLDAHLASGLPWYLENIATDLYASYHRFTDNKPVNWRYEAARAQHRSDPADTGAFVREPGLSDPVWRDRIAARMASLAAAQSRYHPLFYNLADEAGIADVAAAWDFDFSPSALSAFRIWLKTQYADLAALNAEWSSAFPRWDDVMPETTDATLRRTDANHAAWADFKAFMDVAFATAVRSGTDALHQADPAALAGLEGAQVPGWGGYDYGLLAHAVDVMEIYDSGDAVALARTANPDLIVLRTSFGPGDGAALWRSLLQGGRGTIVWDEDSIVAVDGTPKPRGVELARTVAQLRTVAPAIAAARPSYDAIAVLVSQASFRTTWLLDRQPGGSAWSERDAAREGEDNVWRASRRETLQRLLGLGLQPRLFFSPQLETGILARDGVRVLILPHAIALSDTEVAAIRRFAASGGTVLADTEPGRFDGHSRLRATAPLAEVAQIPEALYRSGAIPDADTLDTEASVLASAGVVPRARVQTASGQTAAGLELRWFDAGDHALLSLQPTDAQAAARQVSITFATPCAVVDLRRPGPAQTARTVRVTLDPTEPAILSIAEP